MRVVLPVMPVEDMKDRETQTFYPSQVIEDAVTEYSKIVDTEITTGEIVRGKDSHSSGLLSHISHLVTDISIEDKLIYSEFSILNTPFGMNLRKLIRKYGTEVVTPVPILAVHYAKSIVVECMIVDMNITINWNKIKMDPIKFGLGDRDEY